MARGNASQNDEKEA
ncbi:unnamed protein product, partial [Rotaria magnacalcarata]